MALAAGLHGAVRLSFFRAGKVDQFGSNFRVKIITENDTIRPFRKITGKIVVETRFPIKHKGILIQFEGLCKLRYATKLDNRTSFHQGRQCIMKNVKPEVDGYQESPIRHIIQPDAGDDSFIYVINCGTETYPSFLLEIDGDPHLPAPFKNSFGDLVYRLVVYMKSTNGIYVEVGEKVMRFGGHHNLLSNVEALKPISNESFYKKSFFSRKNLAEVVFSVDTAGFLPGESVPFILYVKNAKCIPLQATVQVVKTIKYDASGRRDSAKRKIVLFEGKEKDELEPEPEMTWVDELNLPEFMEPSYCAHSMYNVYIRYTGEAPIYIGTTRDPLQILMNNSSGLDVPFQGIRRRGSASSTHSVRSHNSATTTYSLPPAYSQLSSRKPSMETLPPAYDDVGLIEDGELTLQVPTTILSPLGNLEDDE